MADPTLSDLKAFANVARHRSFRAAADTMGVSRSTLSHAIRGLEQQLGVRLLNRTTRSVAATEAGQSLLARLGPLLGDLDDMLAQARGVHDSPAGHLRINAPEAGCRWLLRHVVPQFLDTFPLITLDLVSEGRFVDIVADGFDAGVRLREAVPQDMVAVAFGGAVRFLAVVSPQYLARYGQPAMPDDLKHHRCIRQRLPSGKAYRWEFERNGQEVAVEVPGSLTLDHSGLMVEAAEEGLGIAYVPESVARDALTGGRLKIVLEHWSPPSPGLCLYYPGHRHVPPALRAFLDTVRAV
jgi:DNA-binding transcriptional LysR family regulator